MKIIHDDGYNESERLLYKAVVYSNTVQSLLPIVKAMKELSIQYERESVAEIGSNYIRFVEGKCKMTKEDWLISSSSMKEIKC